MDQKNPRSGRTAPGNTRSRARQDARRPAPRKGKAARRAPRKKAKRLNIRRLLVLLAAIAIACGIGWLVYDAMHQTQHMMPTIQRIPEYAQETAVPQ